MSHWLFNWHGCRLEKTPWNCSRVSAGADIKFQEYLVRTERQWNCRFVEKNNDIVSLTFGKSRWRPTTSQDVRWGIRRWHRCPTCRCSVFRRCLAARSTAWWTGPIHDCTALPGQGICLADHPSQRLQQVTRENWSYHFQVENIGNFHVESFFFTKRKTKVQAWKAVKILIGL